jgi:hypothetical protein
VRATEFDDAGERAVVAGERVEVVVHVVHFAEVRELAGRRVVFCEARAGVGADPEGAVGTLIEAERGDVAGWLASKRWRCPSQPETM